MRTIAKHLVARGYDVCFVSSSGYRQYIEVIGASFVPVEGYGDFYDLRARDLDPRCMLPFSEILEDSDKFLIPRWRMRHFRVPEMFPDQVN